MKVSVSLLSLINREEGLLKLNNTNCDYIHIDVMDGVFVNNKQYSINEIKELSLVSKKKLDVHLMVEDPIIYINELISLNNIEYITIHLEIDKNIDELLSIINSNNIKCGLSIKPNTDIEKILPYLSKVNLILIMSVKPGLGGQEFILNTFQKVKDIKNLIDKRKIEVSVDGGINNTNIRQVKENNIDMVVVGSYITNNINYQEYIDKIK